MPSFDGRGFSMHYEVGGSGPPLLLIPGMLSDSATWLPVVGPLETAFTVIRPDNRATGRSQGTEDFLLPDCADDLAALLDHLGLDGVHVAGHSMGGYLALMLADRVGPRLASISLLASAPANGARNAMIFNEVLKLRRDGPPMQWLRVLYPWLQSPGFFADAGNMEQIVLLTQAYPHAQSLTSMARQIKALRGFTPRNGATALPCPAQAVLAGRDLLFPVADAKAALGDVPWLKFHVVEEAAHAIHWEAPGPVISRLRAIAGL